MGVVYAAHDERLDRAVAIKRMRQGADEQERQRLWREARVAASVSHPNICQLYEIEEDGGELFLTMELLDGEPLSARLDRGPLSPAEAGQIALSVLSALGRAARPGHRPPRPEAVQHLPVAARRQAARLRHRARAAWRRRGPGRTDAVGPDRRHPALHGAGAARGEHGRPAQRPVRARHGALRDGRGPSAVRRRIDFRGRDRDSEGRAAGARRVVEHHRAGPDHPAGAPQAA